MARYVVRVGREHLGERGEPGRRDQRVAVEGPLLRGAAVDRVHHVGAAAERRAPGVPPQIAFAQHARSGYDAVALDRAAVRDGRAALHLVEDQQRAVLVQQVLEALEVAGLRLADADVHHHRLEDQARDLVAALVEQRARAPRGR